MQIGVMPAQPASVDGAAAPFDTGPAPRATIEMSRRRSLLCQERVAICGDSSVPSFGYVTFGRTVGGQLSLWAKPRSYQVTPAIIGRWRAT